MILSHFADKWTYGATVLPDTMQEEMGSLNEGDYQLSGDELSTSSSQPPGNQEAFLAITHNVPEQCLDAVEANEPDIGLGLHQHDIVAESSNVPRSPSDAMQVEQLDTVIAISWN